MALNDMKARSARLPEGKKRMKLTDGDGLYLLVTESGKYWRFDYRFEGRRKTAAFGVYPKVSLKEARERRDEFRYQLRQGKDPMADRHRRSGEDTFRDVALEWHEKRKGTLNEKYWQTTSSRLERYVFPKIGRLPISSITAPTLLTMLEGIERSGYVEMAHRVKVICGQVFRYGVASGRCDRDPTADLRGALTPRRARHMPTILDEKRIGELLRAIRGYEGDFATRHALMMAPYVFVRPGELRRAEWAEFDLKERIWRIPAEKMKMKRLHLVPLSRQVVDILKSLRGLSGGGRYLFPSVRDVHRPLSDMTLNAALRRLGFGKDEIVVHGFRSMASTLLHERGWPTDAIERQLAHAERNQVKGAYNHAQFLDVRTRMMQEWADYLDSLAKTGHED